MEERITSMIPRYGKLNKIYTEMTSGNGFSFEKQRFISDFYREYGDTQTFEPHLSASCLNGQHPLFHTAEQPETGNREQYVNIQHLPGLVRQP